MQDLKDSLKYKHWAKALADNSIQLNALEELSTIRKGNGEVLFSMVKMDAVSPESEPLLPIALIRGHFVAILISLVNASTGQESFLMVNQRRVATGGYMLEHPAGMVDSSKDPYAVAVTEVHEETGIQIDRSQLILLKDRILYSSPGLIDEGGYFFAVQLTLSDREITDLHDNAQGHGTEGEFIQTLVLSREEAMQKSGVANALLHFYLWDDYKRQKSLS